MTKKQFDGVVLIIVLTTVAMNGLIKGWARRTTANGGDGAGVRVAGATQLAL